MGASCHALRASFETRQSVRIRPRDSEVPAAQETARSGKIHCLSPARDRDGIRLLPVRAILAARGVQNLRHPRLLAVGAKACDELHNALSRTPAKEQPNGATEHRSASRHSRTFPHPRECRGCEWQAMVCVASESNHSAFESYA